MNPSIEDTVNFISCAHHEQYDKGGNPYWWHPVSVMHRLGPDASHEEKLVALLHDVLEDTEWTAADLLAAGYSQAVVEAVQLLTRPEGPTYLDWVRSIVATGNRLAIRVKIADNEDNSSIERVHYLPAKDQERTKRYAKSLAILRPALTAIAA